MNDKNYTNEDGELWEAKKSNRSLKSKDGELWEWDESSETTEAVKKLHEDIRQRKLKEQDDQLNYETGGK